MNISRAQESDAESIARVEMTSGYPHDTKFNALPLARSLLLDKKEHVFVIREKGKIIGYISLRKENKAGEIGFLAVAKYYQGKGAGKRLIRFVLQYAKKLGCKKITLSVLSSNKKAILLYKKFGFKVISTIRKRKGSRIVTKLEMEKKL